MNRRELLTTLPALAGVGLLPSASNADPPPLLIQRSPLADFQYHHGEHLYVRISALAVDSNPWRQLDLEAWK